VPIFGKSATHVYEDKTSSDMNISGLNKIQNVIEPQQNNSG
jgi:hypothetical protein